MIPTLNDSLMNSLNTVPNLNNNKSNKFNQSDLDDLTDWDKFTTDKENYNTQPSSSNNMKMKMDLVIYEEPIALNYNNLQTSISNNLKTDTTDYVQTSNDDYKFKNNDLNSNKQQLGLIGLTNLGNTCYMNSGLQCLFNNKKLIYFFLNEYLKNSSKINLANNSLTSCFISLMKKVWKKTPRDYNVIKPSEFKEIMSQNYSQFQGFRQHDCQEFLSLLLGTLHDQINQGLNKTILNGELEPQKTKQTIELNNNEQSPLSNCCSTSPKSSSISTSSTYCDQLSEEENDNNNLQIINENLTNNTTVVNCIQSYSRLINNSSSKLKTTISKDELNSQLQLSVKELVGKDTKLNNTNLHTDLNNQELTYDSKKFNNKITNDNDIIVCSTNKAPMNTVDVNLLNEDYSDRCSDSTTSTNSSTNSILKRNKKRNNDKQLNNKITEIIINDDEQYSSPKRQKTDSDYDDCSNNNLSTISNTTITNDQQFDNNLKTNDKFSSDLEWNKYLTKNKSIIVDTFQGQLKSTVKCSKCLNVSITYEPFMYLPITLPSNALERQIFVTYIPISSNPCYNNDIKSARRYLLTLNKHDKLDKLINQLKNLLIKDDWGNDNTQLCIAEVEDKFIHKILDNNTLLKYVDDKFKDLYAFEMIELNFLTTIQLPALTSSLSKPEYHYLNDIQNYNQINNSDFIGPQLPPNDQILQSTNDYQNTFMNSTFTNNNLNNDNEIDLTSLMDNNQLPTITNTSSTTTTNQIINTDNFNGELFSKKFIGYNLNYLADSKLNQVNNELDNENYIAFNDPIPFDELDSVKSDDSRSSLNNNDLRKNNQMQFNEQIPLSNKNDDDLTIVENFDTYNLLPIQLSCAICLEEKDSEELLIHQACSCQLCCPCLDMTVKHCSENETNFLCPTCSQLISKSDFVPFFGSKKPQNFLTNYYIIPILFRIPEKINYNNFKLVIRPILLRLPSLLSGSELYEVIDKFVPCQYVPYSCVFVNKSGQKCIRCDYNSSCTGCEITRIGDVSIYPQDCIAVEFESSYSHELEQMMPDALKLIQDHHSVHDYRKPEKLTLEYCLNLFNQSEILDDDWFCSVCDSNQKAKKSLTIWKAPDTLIVYLKRFVFHDMNSIKIDEPVEYPLEKFDISPYFQVDNKFKEDNQNESLIYDLKNIICHSGSVSSGHYTAFSKHFLNNKWYYLNDEEVLEITPSTSDERAYILFYQRSSNLNLDFLCDDIKK